MLISQLKLRLYVGQMKEKVSKFTYPMFPHYFIVLHITNTHSMRKIINQRSITCEKPSHQNFRQICTSTLLSLTKKKQSSKLPIFTEKS